MTKVRDFSRSPIGRWSLGFGHSLVIGPWKLVIPSRERALMSIESSDPRLTDLLVRWKELKRQGQLVTPEDLCRDCPELLEALKLHVNDLNARSETPRPAEAATLPPPDPGVTGRREP